MTTQARSLKLSVGKKGKNLENDVKVVQHLLNLALQNNPKFKATGIARLVEDGDCGDLTEAAIVAYQEKVLGWSGPAVDGTVEPNKTTWKSLNGNVGDPAKVKRAVVPRPTKVEGYSAFKQGDYSTVQLGEGDLKISGHGCALCTLTMAATVIGTPTKHWPKGLQPVDLTPPRVNDILRTAGAFSKSLLKMANAAEALGMNYYEYGRGQDTKPSDVALIEINLLAGFPVAAHVDYKSSGIGDHWVLIVRRVAPCEFDAIDPATGRVLALTSAPQSMVDGPAVTRLTSIDKGVLFGWGRGGSNNQQKYVVVRFALLEPAYGGFCEAV